MWGSYNLERCWRKRFGGVARRLAFFRFVQSTYIVSSRGDNGNSAEFLVRMPQSIGFPEGEAMCGRETERELG